MRVLIVETDCGLADLWRRHLVRQGAVVVVARSQASAMEVLRQDDVDAIVLDLDMGHAAAFAVADFASYRQPRAPVIFVTRARFFSDGSIFNLMPNARAFLAAATPPEDLAAVVDYCAAT